jgi:hypothetical protein
MRALGRLLQAIVFLVLKRPLSNDRPTFRSVFLAPRPASLVVAIFIGRAPPVIGRFFTLWEGAGVRAHSCFYLRCIALIPRRAVYTNTLFAPRKSTIRARSVSTELIVIERPGATSTRFHEP